MPQSKPRRKQSPKRVLALPDLEQAKAAVLNSLTSASGQRTYDHAMLAMLIGCGLPRAELLALTREPHPGGDNRATRRAIRIRNSIVAQHVGV
jgi:hypothetical protein